MKKLMVVALILMVMLCFGAISFAGNLDDTGLPTSSDSAMYTLENIYDRLDSNTQATKRSGAFVEPSDPPGSTGHTLDQVYEKAIPTQVSKTGQTPTDPHTAPNLSDGNLTMGVEWPNPRFADNGDGTVTDNLTGLIWLQNATCLSGNWTQALSLANGLASGVCGLSDGSSAGDWRLPNIKEQLSLVSYAFAGPALSDDAGTGQWTSGAGSSFTNVEYHNRGASWTSSMSAYCGKPDHAWKVDWYHGRGQDKNALSKTNYVWPVRGGQ